MLNFYLWDVFLHVIRDHNDVGVSNSASFKVHVLFLPPRNTLGWKSLKVFHLIRSFQRPHFTCAGFRATCLCFKILSSSWPCEIEAIGRLLRACTTLQDQSGPLQLTPTAQTSRPRALQVANHEWFHSSSDAELPASTLCLDCIKCPLKSKSYYHDSTIKKWNGKVKKKSMRLYG